MANEKFEPMGTISDIEIRLECLRLATEFGPEFERKDPLEKAEKYFNWVKQISSDNRKDRSKKSLIADCKGKVEIRICGKSKRLNQSTIGGT